ncbi:MAG: ATP-binding cassette domain-containing protein [Hyphomicrobiaceae bacterium]
MSDGSLIAVSGVRFRWPGREGFELQADRFQMAAGEQLLLVGPSGSGKSTLLSLIAGIVAPDLGRITVLGRDLGAMRASARDQFRVEHMGLIFQMFNLLPYGTAIDNVLLPLRFAPVRRARLGNAGAQLAEARRLLARLGLDPDKVGRKRADALSVGQQQRVAAARALIGGPELVIADEPTSALDHAARDKFLDLVTAELQRSGAGLLMVSHDPTLAPHFNRVVDLSSVIQTAVGGGRTETGNGATA